MRVGIQGKLGSACDEAAALLLPDEVDRFDYLTDAGRTLAALAEGLVDKAVLALESPEGEPLSETADALLAYPTFVIVKDLRREVRHCLLVHPRNDSGTVRKIASHGTPLAKHAEYLATRFPGYEALELEDSGLAAERLALGQLSLDTAVIAMPRAAEAFGLKILVTPDQLPANDDWKTRFAVMARPS